MENQEGNDIMFTDKLQEITLHGNHSPGFHTKRVKTILTINICSEGRIFLQFIAVLLTFLRI